MYISWGKRLFDVAIAAVLLVSLAPLMLLVGVCIVAFDRGPVLFAQRRVGKLGRNFTLYKFRSMPVGTASSPSASLELPRLSWVGKVLRRTNIDELPQLVNILLGDMSVVGPRPSMLDQAELIELRRRNGSFGLRPGLTGLAQVKSFDGMSVERKAFFDGEYARAVSFTTDVRIVLATFVYLLRSPPVY